MQALHSIYVENITAVNGEFEIIFPSETKCKIHKVRNPNANNNLYQIYITIPLMM